MKNIFIVFSFICIPMLLQAQEQTDELRMEYGLWGNDYFIGNQKVPYDSVVAKLEGDNRQLIKKFEAGNAIRIGGNVVAGIGGFLIGYDMGGRLFNISERTNDKTALYTGVVLLFSGLIASGIGEVKMRKALTLYNNKTTSFYIKPTENGLSLAVVF